MSDVLQQRLDGRTLDGAIAEAHRIIADAVTEFGDWPKLALFSGGNDSTVLLHLTRDLVDAAVHANTGIGIEQTREFVRQVCHDWWIRLIEVFPTYLTYEEHVLRFGFPGPAHHQIVYSHLKERAIRTVRKMYVQNGRSQRVFYLTGVRSAESSRRMGNAREVSRDGSVVWVNPLTHFSNAEMREYRERFGLPRNEVADHIHKSGECLCGAFAKPGEKEELRFFYPEVAEYIDRLEERVRAAGQKSCVWGPQGIHKPQKAGRLCSSCEHQQELFCEVAS